jgi:hypothetical protein
MIWNTDADGLARMVSRAQNDTTAQLGITTRSGIPAHNSASALMSPRATAEIVLPVRRTRER